MLAPLKKVQIVDELEQPSRGEMVIAYTVFTLWGFLLGLGCGWLIFG
jgi:hypothetical protein